MTELKVVTEYNKDMIRQRIESDDRFSYPETGNIAWEILQLKDQGIREALIKLGWTPPPVDFKLPGAHDNE